MTVESLLEHHGVKGMHWGIRKDRGHEGEEASTKKIARLDKKFARRSQTPRTTIQIYNRAAKNFNENDLERINNKPQYKNADFTRDSPLRKKYYNEHKNALLDQLQKAADEFGTNASGTASYGILERPNNAGWDIYLKEVKHADESNKVVLKVRLKFDSTGHIVGLELVDNVAQQTALGEEFLEHYGVKGMHWGIRTKSKRSRPQTGESRSAQELRKRPASQLTNQQLKKTNERLNLEQNFNRLNPTTVAKGHNYAKGILALTTTATSLIALSQTPLGKRLISAGVAAMKNTQLRTRLLLAAKRTGQLALF